MSASNLVWHDHQVTHAERVARHAQQPAVLWFTGLSGSGKSTIANALEVELLERGNSTTRARGRLVLLNTCRVAPSVDLASPLQRAHPCRRES